ncbi:MAG: methionyl-tRNA formyltransferase [Brevinema sp.]
MKIIFFGNSNFSILPLQKLIETVDVIAVVTSPDSFIGRGQNNTRTNPVKELAIAHHIPIFQPTTLKNNKELLKSLQTLKADLHIIVSYGKIIPNEMIDIPPYKTINLHASCLPIFRGAAPIQYALWNGLNQTGNTVQFITEKMDEGDIITQSIVLIEEQDDYTSLEKKLAQDGANLLSQSLSLIQEPNFTPKKQNHQQASYTKLITKEDGAVFFSMVAQDIINAFRAFKEKPGIFLPLSIGNIKILDCHLGSGYENPNSKTQEGEILTVNPQGITVACHDGSIILTIVQAPNKKAVSAKDFINGNRLTIGSILK